MANAVGALYLASLILAAARRGRSWRRAVALRRSVLATPLPGAIRVEAERCRQSLGLALGDVAVRRSSAVVSPVTLREVGGKDEIDMMEPSFDGRRLSFKLKSRDGKTHSIELRLTGEGQGDYVEVSAGAEVGAEGHNPDLVVKMTRAK